MNWWLQAGKEMGLYGAIGAVVGMPGGLLHALGCWLLSAIRTRGTRTMEKLVLAGLAAAALGSTALGKWAEIKLEAGGKLRAGARGGVGQRRVSRTGVVKA